MLNQTVQPSDEYVRLSKRQQLMIQLTPRESELVTFLQTSLPLDMIALRMRLQASTVKVNASLLYRKLAVSGRVEMMAREIDRLRKGDSTALPV